MAQLRHIGLMWLLPAVLLVLAAAPAAQAGHQVPLVTENSYGQNRPATRSATGSNAGEAPIQAARSGGFPWGDAGIGAGSAVALMLFIAGATLGIRRNRARRAYV